jgi:hypothetical protein
MVNQNRPQQWKTPQPFPVRGFEIFGLRLDALADHQPENGRRIVVAVAVTAVASTMFAIAAMAIPVAGAVSAVRAIRPVMPTIGTSIVPAIITVLNQFNARGDLCRLVHDRTSSCRSEA